MGWLGGLGAGRRGGEDVSDVGSSLLFMSVKCVAERRKRRREGVEGDSSVLDFFFLRG